MGKAYHANNKHKKAGAATLPPDKINIKAKKITRDKEEQSTMITG